MQSSMGCQLPVRLETLGMDLLRGPHFKPILAICLSHANDTAPGGAFSILAGESLLLQVVDHGR